jgi:hypothetical protein
MAQWGQPSPQKYSYELGRGMEVWALSFVEKRETPARTMIKVRSPTAGRKNFFILKDMLLREKGKNNKI